MFLVCSIVVNVLAAIVLACIYIKRTVRMYRHEYGWNITYKGYTLSRYIENTNTNVDEFSPQIEEELSYGQ